jgi:hypothetical protein
VESLAIAYDRGLPVTQGQVQHMTIQDRFLELAGPPTEVQVVFYGNLIWLHVVGLVRSVKQGVCGHNRRTLCKNRNVVAEGTTQQRTC